MKGVAYSGRRRFSTGKIESFVPLSIEISVKTNRALTKIVEFDVLFVTVCVAKYSSVKDARFSRCVGFALSEHIVMLADFVMFL